MVNIPRLVISATSSSAGKTTIATGVMAALRTAGQDVAGFKVGPDYIDPGYHSMATGRPGRNLDPALTGEVLVPRLFAYGVQQPHPAQVAIIEGVMGLFDGQLDRDGFGSTAHVARLLAAPVVLVVDAAGSSRTAAAAALGLQGFDPTIDVAGVIVNRVASDRHAKELTRVFTDAGMSVLGVVPRSASIAAPSRHLGLVPAAEREQSRDAIDALARHISRHVDLDAVLRVAHTAPRLHTAPWNPHDVVTAVPGEPLVAVMAGRAFTFRYPETTELLQAAGCRVVDIDPLTATELPVGLSGLYIGGGFPEIHATELSNNTALRTAIADAIAAGLPTVAECAGQLYLARDVDGHPMVGAIPGSARMTPRLTLGYRSATATTDTVVAAQATTVTGHEFHRTITTPPHDEVGAWQWRDVTEGFSYDPAGTGIPTLYSSYLHVHWAGYPACAQRFADAAAEFSVRTGGVKSSPGAPVTTGGIDLDHHGDKDIEPGLVDLAVNVMTAGPPDWLADELSRTVPQLGAYPDVSLARTALAAAHQVPENMVLPTAGGAEAFVLVARTLTATHPMVVHPQFTEPEAALLAAGHTVQRWILPLDGTNHEPPSLHGLPDWADAVFIGNPTNPTGWLHPRSELLEISRNRLVVVDEAFMDATDEAESLISDHMPNQLVLRSLSKTWGLAGLRVGYVVGDPALIARLEQAQPPWPVSAGAIAAMVGTSTASARTEAVEKYQRLYQWRDHLVSALDAAGFRVTGTDAPFVLIDTSECGPQSLRPALARAGFSVRRGESFPGLSPQWIRIKVPPPQVADAFVSALSALRTGR